MCFPQDRGVGGGGRQDIRLPPRPPILGERDVFPPGLGGRGAEALFRDGLCLPSGTAMSDTDLARVATVVRGMHGAPPEGRQSVSSEDAVI